MIRASAFVNVWGAEGVSEAAVPYSLVAAHRPQQAHALEVLASNGMATCQAASSVSSLATWTLTPHGMQNLVL
eukprot:7564648-Alexandrium_andersonii.AAC.1